MRQEWSLLIFVLTVTLFTVHGAYVVGPPTETGLDKATLIQLTKGVDGEIQSPNNFTDLKGRTYYKIQPTDPRQNISALRVSSCT